MKNSILNYLPGRNKNIIFLVVSEISLFCPIDWIKSTTEKQTDNFLQVFHKKIKRKVQTFHKIGGEYCCIILVLLCLLLKNKTKCI